MKEELFTVEQLAEYLRMNVKTIRNRMSCGQPLPPSFKLPDSRVRLWRASDVYAWVNKIADKAIAAEAQKQEEFCEITAIVRRRGRPKKERTRTSHYR